MDLGQKKLEINKDFNKVNSITWKTLITILGGGPEIKASTIMYLLWKNYYGIDNIIKNEIN